MEREPSTSNGYGGDNNTQRRKRENPVMWPDRKAYKEHRMRLQKDLRREQSIDKRRRRLLERPVQQLLDSKTPTASKGQKLSRMFRRVHDS